MPTRRGRTSIAANPVLIGAAATLIILVGVFLAYNANNGLPFVPTYTVHVQVPDAAELVVGNDVRIGGSRVGVVKSIDAVSGGTRPTATLELSLEKSVEPLMSDTQVIIRQRSNLGLKYVDLTPGRRGTPIPQGGTLALRNSTGIVDLDDALSAFDKPTRDAVGGVARNLGTGFAGRAGDLSRTFQDAPQTLTDLEIVARTLSSPATALIPFIRGAAAAAAAVSPVTPQLGGLLSAGATTFRAIGDEQGSIARALDAGPGAVEGTTRSLASLRPLLAEARTFLGNARPGLAALPASAAALDGGLRAAGPVLADAKPFTTRVGGTLDDLRALSRRPSTAPALRRLAEALAPTTHALETIAPFQTRCNYLGLWGRNVPGVVSEGDTLGTWFRFIPIVTPEEELRSAKPASNLHASDASDTGYGGRCEPGNQPYLPGQQIGTPAGAIADRTEDTAPPAQSGGTR